MARAASYDHQFFRPSRSVDDKALLAARVKFSGAIVRAWWRVWLPLEVEFLGFGRDMQGSTSVVLASSGEVWICADLIGRGADCLGLRILTQQ